jgi:hypothetical protein
MDEPADPKKPARKSLWQRFLELLVPPWIQVALTILCLGIVYVMELWVRPQAQRLRVERQAAVEIRNQVVDLEKKLPQEREQDLEARVRKVRGQTVNSPEDLEKTVRQIGQILKQEGWKAKISPSPVVSPTAEVPSLEALPVVVEVSLPPEFSQSSRETDQARFLRLLRKLSVVSAKHQLVGLEIRSSPVAGFSGKLTYHFYRIRRG